MKEKRMKKVTNAQALEMIAAAMPRKSATPHQAEWADRVAACNAWKVAAAGAKAANVAKKWARLAMINVSTGTRRKRRPFAGYALPSARKAVAGDWGGPKRRALAGYAA